MQVIKRVLHNKNIKGPYFFLGVLFLIYTVIGDLRLLEGMSAQVAVVIIVSNMLLLYIATRYLPNLKEWVAEQTTENLMLLHVVRAPIGMGFMVVASHGLLPNEFAQIAGKGDILAGSLAVLCVMILPFVGGGKRRVIIGVWNVIGMVDLFLAVGTAVKLTLVDRSSMEWMLRLPFFLIPGFLVPWLMATHFIILRRLIKGVNAGF